MAERDPERAEASFAIVETTGRDALTELRRLLGVLRRPPARLETSPAASLGELGDVLDQVRGTGLPVDFQVVGPPVPLAPGVDLTAYRIVQEALTNALKHGGGHAKVRVDHVGDELLLTVSDHGDGTPRPRAESGGHGLVGMRERIRVIGGDLRAGPRPGGGFEVEARLPLQGEAEAALAAAAPRDPLEANA
jgi:signal transduction histidine kinase